MVAEPRKNPARGRARTALRALALALSAGLLLATCGVAFAVHHYSRGLPRVETLRSEYRPPQVTRVLARDGVVLADLFTERRTVVAFEEIPVATRLAFLAAEDASFYEHEGLDYLGMLRALVVNLRAGETRQGGSTITQQVVKNVLLDPERTLERKIRETLLARELEQTLSKDEILALYLNHIYLGHGRYGVEEAARHYFGKKAAALDLAESALLAGIVAAPERLSPRRSPERSLDRRRHVLAQMRAKGFITQALHDAAQGAKLRIAPTEETDAGLCPEAVSAGRALLAEVAGAEAARAGGFEIATTISPELQAAARRAVRSALASYAERRRLLPPWTAPKRDEWGAPHRGAAPLHRPLVGVVEATDDARGTLRVRVGDAVGRVILSQESRYNPAGLEPSRFTRPGAVLRVSLLAPAEGDEPAPLRLELGPEAALVALDVRTGEVLALVGSHEALPGGLDRATQSRRQPGSAWKPIVFAAALQARRITPAAVLEVPAAHPAPGQPATRRIQVRDGFARSDNDLAVAVLRDVGAPRVVELARALGVESKLGATDSLALGAYEVTPLELAAATATFARGGVVIAPRLVTALRRSAGGELPLPPLPPPRRALEPDEAYLVTSLLRSVVTSGTARRARTLGHPVAGKTGTTNDARDTWFVGYSTEIVAAVWVGYDDNLPLGRTESGAVTALPAFLEFLRAASAGRPGTEFVRPPSIVTARVDRESGLLAREGLPSVEEEFLDGTVPEALAPEPDAGAPAPAGADAGRVVPPGLPDSPALGSTRDAGERPDELPPF